MRPSGRLIRSTLTSSAPPPEDVLPRWMDAAELVLVLSVATLAVLEPHSGPATHPAHVALVALAVAPFVLVAAGVRLDPLVVGLGSIAPLAVANLAGGALGIIDTSGFGPQFSLFLLIYAVGRTAAHLPPSRSWPATALAAAVPFGRSLVDGSFDPWIFWEAGVVLALITGLGLRVATVAVIELRAAQASLARDAALEERQRIAREIHDVIAHTLTVTMMHVTAARLALRRDTGEAAESLAEAERLGRQSLADVRRTVGLLRTDGDRATDAALPSAEDVTSLVGSYRAAGLEVALIVDGELDRLPGAVSLAVYRVVQEALANVAKHAPGAAARVVVTSYADEVYVGVRNGPGDPARTALEGHGGAGLVGMRERVALLNGTFHAGPDGEGWTVEATLPLSVASESVGAETPV